MLKSDKKTQEIPDLKYRSEKTLRYERKKKQNSH